MQFANDIEMCIRNPFKLRKIPEPRRTEIREFLHTFRQMWFSVKKVDLKELNNGT